MASMATSSIKNVSSKAGATSHAYREPRKSAMEEASFLARRKKQGDFANEVYEKKRDIF